jgi:hypothetical protein
MIGITLTADQIRNAPPQVRQWIEHEVMAGLGLAADALVAPSQAQPAQTAHLVGCSVEEVEAILARIQGMLPAVNVLFEFSRPAISYGTPPVMAFRLLDIMHHTRLANIEQVTTCLGLINQALTELRKDPTARFCAFDHVGHCLIPPETQQSIAALWRRIAERQADGLESAA